MQPVNVRTPCRRRPLRRVLGRLPVWLVCIWFATAAAASPWGANYFPNVELVTHDGETVRFFDDLIENKVVAINFIYTTCVDTCPLETAQLTKVQQILGDRLGKDIFFYSITIDPDHDTPVVLRRYRDQFKAQWAFLTGKESDIVLLRKRLGLYLPEIQDGSNNHNVSMIIGNQATGRWMKRSPFENPYVLADQLGSWLTGWKDAPRGPDYAQAPQLRAISDGEQLYRSRCAICHTVDGSGDQVVGPDLQGVTLRRDRQWLVEWLRAPDKMLERGDPIATALLKAYNGVPMPNLRLSEVDVTDILGYLEQQTPEANEETIEPAGDVVAVANAWIREMRTGASATAGYMTVVNIGEDDLSLIGIRSPAFDKVEVHEMVTIDDLPRMRKATPLDVPVGGRTRMAPGGKHLMLIGPRSDIEVGQQIDITLVFASGHEQTITLPVASQQSLGATR